VFRELRTKLYNIIIVMFGDSFQAVPKETL